MTKVIDPEGTQIAGVRSLATFRRKRVLEIGCGDGRLTWEIAGEARTVLAVDPDRDSIATAQAALPPSLAETVTFRVAGAAEVEVSRCSIDLVFLSWSL
jgi:ubiquinone/menaquinone biosynthesis C-methylase UbiE